ncbi:helix-turn-helix domain-containing protein [Galbitalea sp. SE-J8]|uniref:TetR/AcrR family transcriptional regulator n=1 Tax=Galbitalea sp. SE-J8 TaxID=3054952 RepID=UPI00259CFE8F|nr:TetR/AcrR family transcriptional regulator [Galbitalea sp. SE-J8]MDM4764194.1 helix-turn-helix domain-containing protein [Galbitalea sp. SE-J8]
MDAAMDLFGRQGFRGTTIAQIEAAAGLTPGAGGLYRHFASKKELLEAGVAHQLQHTSELGHLLDPVELAGIPAGSGQFLAVADASLRRLDAERDVNRLLLRDLAEFPELLDRIRDNELRRVHQTFTAWLRSQAPDPAVDVGGLAAVLMSALSHFWILSDAFGEYPLEIDRSRFLASLAEVATRMLRAG